MKTLLIFLVSCFTYAAQLDCTAHREWLDDQGNLQKEVSEVPVLTKLPGITKLQLDTDEAFYAINDFSEGPVTLSIVFPPSYTVGGLSKAVVGPGQESTLNSISGTDVFKIRCKRRL